MQFIFLNFIIKKKYLRNNEFIELIIRYYLKIVFIFY